MSLTVCLSAKTLYYPQGGGHLWVFLNWALGLRAQGFRVIWLEGVKSDSDAATEETAGLVRELKRRLRPYGLADALALYADAPERLPQSEEFLDLDAAAEADLLLDLTYDLPEWVLKRFRRSAQLDIDPGLLQSWLSAGHIRIAPHDIYFTIGETVGQPGARFPDAGITWHYTPPAVSLDGWKPCPVPRDAPFTTVTHWHMGEWMEDADGVYSNDKRTGYLPFLDLPRHTRQPLELALCLDAEDTEEWAMLRERGWRAVDSYSVTSTPTDYQAYIQGSRGEFSCVKPSCVRLQNAWISDRTICYLASGKPAIVQDTGPSRFLPDAAGLFRFQTLEQAAQCLEKAAEDYERQSRLARQLAEEYFDARKVAGSVVERALA